MRKHFRSRMLVALAILGSAAAVAADCAPKGSGSLADGPTTGRLQGTSTVTGHFSGGGMGFEAGLSVTWEIGTYVLDDGSMVNLDCRTYEISSVPV